MYNTAKQVTGYHADEVNLDTQSRKDMKTRRDANRTRLKKGLAANENPSPVGSHTQGSYAMHTMVQDPDLDYDIDDGVYFKAADLVGPQGGEMSTLSVRKMVCEALQSDQFTKSPEVRNNCVRVFYNEGYHVDVPSYRRLETQDQWTGKISYAYELAGPAWRKSDPKQVTQWFRKTNKDLSPDNGEGQFRRVVRLLKKFSRSRASWKGKNPSGFSLTKVASEVFVSSLNRDDIAIRETMRALSLRFSINKEVAHPVIDEKLNTSEDGRCEHLRNRLDENLKHLTVLDNANCTHSDAMKAWDKVFNTDWFSSQPDPGDGGDDDTAPKSPVDKRGSGAFASRT